MISAPLGVVVVATPSGCGGDTFSASPASDGGADATPSDARTGDGGDVGPAAPCAGGSHFFCEDFDDAATSDQYERLHVELDGATTPVTVVAIESDAAWSPPNALGVHEPAHGADLVADYWQKSFATAGTRLVVTARVRLPAATVLPGDAGLGLTFLSVTDDRHKVGVGFSGKLGVTLSTSGGDGGAPTGTATALPPPDTFVLYELVVDETGHYAKLSMDGVERLGATLAPSVTPLRTVDLQMGAPVLLGPLPALSYQIDDVTLDVQ